MTSEIPAEVEGRPSAWSKAGWGALALALLACLVGAATFDVASWPSFVGDEATYLMAAQSLAWDFDLRYETGDLERFRRLTGRAPDGLILQSPDDGATLYYSKPALYPLAIAPFVRLGGHRGALVFNVMVLGLAGFTTAHALRGWVTGLAPWYTLLAIFASTTFLQVFWLHADLLLLALVAVAFAAVLQRPDVAELHTSTLRALPPRWLLAGAALAAVIASRPVYAPLFLVPLAAAWVDEAAQLRWRRVASLAVGASATLLIFLALSWMLQGSWNSYGTPRSSFSVATGFPYETAERSSESSETSAEVRWSARLEARGGDAWLGGGKTLPFGFDVAEFRWNVLYAFLGRHVGLFPYQAGALLLGLLALRMRRDSWILLVVFFVVLLAFVVLRPFNFWGGGGALANRYILPAVPALWFCARRRIHWAWLLVILGVATPFLLPSWTEPRSFLLEDDNSYRFVAAVAERHLPYETTQSHLKPAGIEDFVLQASTAGTAPPEVWAKSLSPAVRPSGDATSGVRRLTVDPSSDSAHLLIATPAPLRGLTLDLPGAQRGDRQAPRIRLEGARARHRMWWSEQRWYLYELDLDAGLREAEIEDEQQVGLRWF